MAQGRLLEYKLLVEGIEVDFVSATVSCGEGTPASAQIEIPPADSAHDILPNTYVALCWFETSYQQAVDEKGAPIAKRNSTTQEINDRKDPTKWKVLFTGEVKGIGYRQAGGARNIVLTCGDHTANWQSAKVYFGTGWNSATSHKRAIFSGSTQVYAGKQKVTGSNALLNLITAKPTTKPGLPGLLGGIVNLLEAATGVFDHPTHKYQGVNDYMTQTELRLHLSRMVGASEDDDSSQAYLDHGDMRLYYQQLTSQYGGDMSIWDVATSLLGKINHKYTSLLAYPYHRKGSPSKLKYLVPTGANTGLGKDIDNLAKATQETIAAMNSYLDDAAKRANTDTFGKNDPTKVAETDKFGKATAVNSEGFKNYQKSLKSVGGSGSLVTSLKSEEILSSDNSKTTDALSLWGVSKDSAQYSKSKSIESLIDTLPSKKTTNVKLSDRQKDDTARIAAALGEIAHGAALAARTASEADMSGVGNSSQMPSAQSMSNEFPTHHNRENIKAARDRLEAGFGKLVKLSQAYKTVTVKTHTNSQMPQMLLTPDLFMVPPPACNVIFPDQYNQIMYQRDFNSEPTRLWLFGRTTYGMDKQDMYFSPSTDILTCANTKIAEKAIKEGTSFLMPHEIYSGIIPILEPMGDNMVFRKLNKAAYKDKDGKKLSTLQTDDGQNVTGQARYSPQEHMQRAANYSFLSQRFQSRTIQLNMRFSPQLVPGVPAIVLCPTPTLDGSDTPNGTHYLGNVSQIVHQIHSAGTVATTVVLTKCRAHTEGIDLFGQEDEHGYIKYNKIVEKPIPSSRRTYVGDASVMHKESTTVFGKLMNNLNKNLGDKHIEIVDDNAPGDKEFDTDMHRSTTLRIGKKTMTVSMRFIADDRVDKDKDNQFTQGADGKWIDIRKLSQEGAKNLKMGKDLTSTDLLGDIQGTPFDKNNTFGSERQFYSLGGPEGGWNQRGHVEVSIEGQGSQYIKKPLSFSFEATATPPWFASIYMPMQIGNGFYQPMLGCTSILDKAPIAEAGSRKFDKLLGAKTKQDQAQALKEEEKAKKNSKLKLKSKYKGKISTKDPLPPDPVPPKSPEQLEADAGAASYETFQIGDKDVKLPIELFSAPMTVKEAADYLARTWMELQENGADMAAYVDTYTQRSHASLHDLVGNNPFVQFNTSMQEWPNSEPGFHAEAFGPVYGFQKATTVYSDNPQSLLPEETVPTNIFNKASIKPRTIDTRADPRLKRYLSVVAYVEELKKRRTNLRAS